MPITESRVLGSGYETDPIRPYAESFNRTVSNIVSESGYDYYSETKEVLKDKGVQNTLRKFFVEGSYDEASMKPYEVEAFKENQNMLFENDLEALREACAPNTFNALVGMALPMHKNILMNMVWDKGGIPKETAPSPRFTRTMEIRLLVTPDGDEIDMYLEQNKMTDAMASVNPWVDIDLDFSVPGDINGTKELVQTVLGGDEAIDHLDIETHIAAVLVDGVLFKVGETLPDGTVVTAGMIPSGATGVTSVWIPVKLNFGPNYGEVKRTLMRPVRVLIDTWNAAGTEKKQVKIDDIVSASIENDKIMITCMKGQIKGARVRAKLDASMRTIQVPTVKWSEITDHVEIGTDPGIATTISPEEIKDISILYNINQLTKVMSLMKTALANRKNDMIKRYMDDSYKTLDKKSKFFGVFDYAPREGYVLDHIEWRQKTFWDYFDTQVTQMLRVLNDPNMTVSVFGEPDIIRKITPKTYTYQAPAALGPVELDFSKTVVTSDKRVYNFIGSDNLRNNYEMMVFLCPKNSMRITYIIYDYQFYISNEIRNNANPALPQILAFERYKCDEYQPVQGRIQIINPSGLKQSQTGTEVWGPTAKW